MRKKEGKMRLTESLRKKANSFQQRCKNIVPRKNKPISNIIHKTTGARSSVAA
jgi:hypothetical protein